MIYFLFGFLFATINSHNVSDLRKHYGLSYSECGCLYKVFKCMTGCKSIGYQIYRLDVHCKCTCHEMKTTTILPFFKWRTNGTTIKLPKLHSPRLYDIVGTLSPPPTTPGTPMSTEAECPTLPTTVKIFTESGGSSGEEPVKTTKVVDTDKGATDGSVDTNTGGDSNSTGSPETVTGATSL